MISHPLLIKLMCLKRWWGMKITTTHAALGVVMFLLCGQPLALAEKTNVSIQRVEDRTKATVTLARDTKSETEQEADQSREPISVVEDGTLEVMEASNDLLGLGTDRAVEAVSSVGDSAFSWLFRALDFTKDTSKQHEG